MRTNSSMELHKSKAVGSSVVTESGREVSDVRGQPAKARNPILFRFLGSPSNVVIGVLQKVLRRGPSDDMRVWKKDQGMNPYHFIHSYSFLVRSCCMYYLNY